MIEENLKNIDENVAVIAASVNELKEIAKSFGAGHQVLGMVEQTTDSEAVVTACEVDGEKFVRVHAGKYDFRIALHDAEEEMNWDDAMKYAADKGMRLFTLEEGLLMFCFKDEINAKMVELGGDELREDEYHWSSTEGNRYSARYVLFYSGYASGYNKTYGGVVRPVAAF